MEHIQLLTLMDHKREDIIRIEVHQMSEKFHANDTRSECMEFKIKKKEIERERKKIIYAKMSDAVLSY